MENNKPVRLETPQTAFILSQYPEVEFLEAGHVAEWLATRKDQLLILAKEERTGSSLAKTMGLATAAIGAVCYATSPLAPLGALLGLGGYIWAQVADSSHTHTFNPFPFIRGGVLDVVGSMGHSEARKDFVTNYDEFDQLKGYLSPVERNEYVMLREHMALITDYLGQVDEGKRFYAYRWICDQFILMRGSFPSVQQTKQHVDAMQFVSPLVDCDRVKFIQEASKKPEPRSLIMDAPPARIQDAPLPQIQDAPRPKLGGNREPLERQFENSATRTETITHSYNPVNDSKIDIIGEMSHHVQNIFCVGQGGSGKGMMLANAMRAVKAKHPDKRIFVIDGKASDRESGYFDGVADIHHKLKCDVAKDSAVAAWFENAIGEYHRYAAENDVAGTLLIIDEATIIGSKLKTAKSNALGDAIIAIASCGDEQGKNLWMFGQTPFAGGSGIDLTALSQLTSIVLVRSKGVGVLNQWKRSCLFDGVDANEVTKLANDSDCDRAVYWGGSAKWYSMPKLTNYSAFDRDTRTYIKDVKKEVTSNQPTTIQEDIAIQVDPQLLNCILDKIADSEHITFDTLRKHAQRQLPDIAKIESVREVINHLINEGLMQGNEKDGYQIN